MRYKDLITILFVVATASWLWAEPSQEVRVPTNQQSLATQGWTIPDLNLAESTARILKSAEPSKVEPKIYFEPDSEVRDDTLSWSDYDSQEFKLAVSVDPGRDLRSTSFDITFRGPKGFDLIRDGGSDAQFILSFDHNGGETVLTREVHRIAPNRWRFQGSDLQSPNPEEPVKWGLINDSTSFRVTTVLRDQRQSRFSRGANIMLLESDPVELTLR